MSTNTHTRTRTHTHTHTQSIKTEGRMSSELIRAALSHHADRGVVRAAPAPSRPGGAVPAAGAQILPMDCSGFVNAYHNPKDLKKFFISREQLVMDEVELGSGNFGCVKKGVLKTNGDNEKCVSFPMRALAALLLCPLKHGT